MEYSTSAIETAPRRGATRTEGQDLHIDLFATVNGEEMRVHGYGIGFRNQALAARLIAAWTAKAFMKRLILRQYHSTAKKPANAAFISHHDDDRDFAPLGRCLNADLRRMGF